MKLPVTLGYGRLVYRAIWKQKRAYTGGREEYYFVTKLPQNPDCYNLLKRDPTMANLLLSLSIV